MTKGAAFLALAAGIVAAQAAAQTSPSASALPALPPADSSVPAPIPQVPSVAPAPSNQAPPVRRHKPRPPAAPPEQAGMPYAATPWKAKPDCEVPAYGTMPEELAYNQDCPIPPGYRRVSLPRAGVVAGGTVLLSVSYLFSAFIGYADDNRDDRAWLYVPFAGPFVYSSKHGSDHEDGEDVVNDPYLMLGFGQIGGAALILTGLLWRRQVLMRNDVASSRTRWTVLPTAMGRSGMGMTIAGTGF